LNLETEISKAIMSSSAIGRGEKYRLSKEGGTQSLYSYTWNNGSLNVSFYSILC